MKFDDGCGRYSLSTSPQALGARYNLATKPAEFTASYDVSPGQLLPVVTLEAGRFKAELMKWGLVPSWSKDPRMGYRLFNARDDRLFTSPIWRRLILRQRALIPATGFFEWTNPKSGTKQVKQKFYFHPKQLKIFSFAGVWETWHDAEGKEWQTYAIITTEPNQELRPVHNRMPVILHQEDEAAWLEPSRVDQEDIEPYLCPLEDNKLEVVEVSSDVSEWSHNDQRRIAPLNSQ